MSFRRILMLSLALLLALVLPLQAAPPKGQPVPILQEWRGAVDDLALMPGIPECITSAPELEQLWQAWKVPDALPKVDFTQQLVLVSTTRGSRLRVGAQREDNGNLLFRGMATRDLRPGFRYVIALVSREGVKSVNGKPLAAITAK